MMLPLMSFENSLVRLRNSGWFRDAGVYAMADGQYGSTGKGVLSAFMAHVDENGAVGVTTTNQGPNSGHTAYFKGEKIVLKQLPMFPIIANRLRPDLAPYSAIYLNGGAIIDIPTLKEEIEDILKQSKMVIINPQAVRINSSNINTDILTTRAIASTGKGVGPALNDKISRTSGKKPTMDYLGVIPHTMKGEPERLADETIFMEVAQGFSLGIHSNFYPNVTSRECTVAQGMADARLAPQLLRKVALSFRTFPIRVGNTESSSGDCYPDQREISFEELGVEPEYTTVTGRMRRIFTWSRQQFKEAVVANRPELLFINFMNYLPEEDHEPFIRQVVDDYRSVMNDEFPYVLLGFSEKTEDIRMVFI